jgi:hypothetical protein
MDSRERTGRAIHFKGVDHIPHYLPDGKENDILWLWAGRAPDRQPWRAGNDGLERKLDAAGVEWARPVGATNHGEKLHLAIPDLTRQAEFVLPDHNRSEYFEAIRQAVAENNRSDNPRYCLGVAGANSLNEGTHNLIGLDTMFIAYYEHPEHLKALIARLAAEQRKAIGILHQAGCDGVMGYDDWGLQDRLMVSVDLVREFFEPHYRTNWAYAHELGMDVWMHSCGHIVELLPLFAEWGLNVIQEDQQENVGLEALDRAAGGKLAFWCPVDVQKTMVDGSAEDIRAYVKRMMRTIGNHDGGLCSMAYSSPEAVGHAPEKTAAMCEAFRAYGKYDGSF